MSTILAKVWARVGCPVIFCLTQCCLYIQVVRLRAGFALTVFALSSTAQQDAILQAGGLGVSCFQIFLVSDDEVERAIAAFQVSYLITVPCY